MSAAAGHSLFPYDDEEKFVERVAAFLARETELGDACFAVVDAGGWHTHPTLLAETSANNPRFTTRLWV